MAINYSQLRSLTARELISALARDGFVLDRQAGAHQLYLQPDGRRVTVSFHRPGETFEIRLLGGIPVSLGRTTIPWCPSSMETAGLYGRTAGQRPRLTIPGRQPQPDPTRRIKSTWPQTKTRVRASEADQRAAWTSEPTGASLRDHGGSLDSGLSNPHNPGLPAAGTGPPTISAWSHYPLKTRKRPSF